MLKFIYLFKYINMNLYLDDFRNPRDSFNYTHDSDYMNLKWDVVRSYDEFVTFIKEFGLPEIISYDHDLADEHYNYNIPQTDYTEKTGYDCAKWLCEYCMDNNVEYPQYKVHSMNDVGRDNIIRYIENFKKHFKVSDV